MYTVIFSYYKPSPGPEQQRFTSRDTAFVTESILVESVRPEEQKNVYEDNRL